MNRRQEIKIATLLSYFMIGFSMVCGLLYTPWMINVIGKSDYGLYVLVTSFLTYFTVDFGLFNAVNKTVSRCRAQNDTERERLVIGIATKIYLLMDCVVCLALFVTYFFLDRLFSNLSPEEFQTFKNLYLIAGTFSVLSFPFNFLKGVYSAHELFVETKLFDFALKLGTIVFTILLLFIGQGVYSLVLVYGFMPFITNASKAFFLHKKGIVGNYRGWDKTIVKDLVGVSMWLFLSVIAELFINNISPTILAARSTTTQVAIFGIALILYNYIYSFSGVINGMFLPKVTELYVQGKSDEVHLLCYRVARILLYITGFVALGLIAVGRDFIIAWVGPDFNDAYYIAVMLMLPQLFISTINIEYSHLLAADKIRKYSYTIGVAALVTVPLSLLLAGQYGALGVGISIFTSTFIILFGVMLLIYHYNLGFSVRRYLKNISTIVIAMCIIISIYYVMINSVSIEFANPWINFLVRGCIYVAIYLCVIPLTLNSEEKQMAFGFIKSKVYKS